MLKYDNLINLINDNNTNIINTCDYIIKDQLYHTIKATQHGYTERI